MVYTGLVSQSLKLIEITQVNTLRARVRYIRTLKSA